MEALTANALQILEERYLLKNEAGSITEQPEALFHRVARGVAAAEGKDAGFWEEVFFNLMSEGLFLPNSPTLMNAGLPQGQLSACFVLPVEDSLDQIFLTLARASLIHKSGGGTGYNFSKLRPGGSRIDSSGGTASGPVGFMKVFDEATRQVKQGGKRRGANMGILNIDHPDIEAFVRVKADGVSLQNFNLSVGITDEFMNRVIQDLEWSLRNPMTREITRVLPARELWDTIVQMAWQTGDPGLIFLDAINRENPLAKTSVINSTNPCGEVPLQDFESCNLGSVNLSRMLRPGKGGKEVDWERLKITVQHGIRFLDNVITVNHYLLPEVRRVTLANRKIGLGLMGWAELLLELDIPYASTEAVTLAEDLMQFVQKVSYSTSEALAQEKGVFPSWGESHFYPDRRMRNATCNSIAPTGSLAVIANTTYAVEPLYALSFIRSGILDGKRQEATMPIVRKKLEAMGYWDERLKAMIWESGRIAAAHWLPEEVRLLFQTSMEIGWEYHLKHQHAFQRFTDNAVSKTINLPKHTTTDVIDMILMTAWKYGLKGITIYRDQSKPVQVLNRRCGISASSC
ncbi:adenosylcobalamin-dependent ribonucleoside-diphosphate reductase [Robertkochia flava]|uniref:adenosylcobalamin-dependent ribonucleoside-diphosphate reductase n=1 Tax=Robertkochia flava TaxID=3447986 RepID=UPI001CCAA95E|nr:adenosylcobalamin-dependent ribonucleoside-diphosphate reductase [Robertkochia marina]